MSIRPVTDCAHDLCSVPDETVTRLFDFVRAQLRDADAEQVRIGCIGLRPLLGVDELRERFGLDTDRDGMGMLVHTLRAHAKSVQLVYEAGYCLWLLTFSAEVVRNAPSALVHGLVHAVRQQKKEKVLRVCVAALTALCSAKRSDVSAARAAHAAAAAAAAEDDKKGAKSGGGAKAGGADDGADDGEEAESELAALQKATGEDPAELRRRQAICSKHAETALDAGLWKPLQALRARTWADEELLADLENLNSALARSMRTLSSFDQYKKEVLSGRLEWSPPHKNEAFWHENIESFEEDDFRLVKTLKQLAQSENTQVAAIACFDLGEFARIHPRGRAVLEQTNTKPVLISLMASSKNAEVQKQALFCVQKLMLTKAEHLR